MSSFGAPRNTASLARLSLISCRLDREDARIVATRSFCSGLRELRKGAAKVLLPDLSSDAGFFRAVIAASGAIFSLFSDGRNYVC